MPAFLFAVVCVCESVYVWTCVHFFFLVETCAVLGEQVAVCTFACVFCIVCCAKLLYVPFLYLYSSSLYAVF